jgi:hypothetical protein
MPYDPFGSTAAIEAAIRRICSVDPNAYRSVFDQAAALQTPPSLVQDYQSTLVRGAGLQQDVAALFASKWATADSLLTADKLSAVELGFTSRDAVRQALDSFQVPKFETVQSLLLADFVHGSSSLGVLADVLTIAGVGPLLERQGRLLAESYTSFSTSLASSAMSGALGAAGLSAATANLDRSTAFLASLAGADLSAEPFPFAPSRPNWFDVFREDLEARPEGDEGLSVEAAVQAVAETPAARLAAVAGEIITLQYKINRDVETVSGEPIFKPTITGQYVAGMLGLQSVGSREEFDRFAEGLFYLIYEASGDWKRIPLYEPDFPKVADRIKHFRLYAAHDTQHGDSAAIKKKATQVGGHLTDLIGRPLPRTPEDWREAQLALLAEVASFLRHLRERILNMPPSA